jgi:hypothetical protein
LRHDALSVQPFVKQQLNAVGLVTEHNNTVYLYSIILFFTCDAHL